MQHGLFLWWITVSVLAITGSVVGTFCVRAACHYDNLITSGHAPDVYSLCDAARWALLSPVLPIIWVEHTPRSAFLPWMSKVLSAAVFAGLYIKCGLGWTYALFAAVWVMLLLLACIDVKVYLLPDALTQPLLWFGLAIAWAGLNPELSVHASLAGVILGYGLLAVPRALWIWRHDTEGMGAGDVKLLAALGAWAGSGGIMMVLAVACVAAVVFACVHQRRWCPRGAYPFGPFIVLGGMAELLFQSGVQS